VRFADRADVTAWNRDFPPRGERSQPMRSPGAAREMRISDYGQLARHSY